MRIDRRAIFYLLLALGIVWVINIYRAMIGPLVIAAISAYLLYPLVSRLKTKMRIKHELAAGIIFSLFTLVLFTIASLVSPIVLKQSSSLNDAAPAIISRIANQQPRIERTLGVSIPLDDLIVELEKDLAQFLRPERLYRLILATTSNFIYIVITLVATFYLLRDWSRLQKYLVGLFPASLHADLDDLFSDLDIIWKNYLRGQLTLMLFIGVASGIVSFFLGLRSALLIGLIAGALELIPSIGPTITTIVAASNAWIFGSAHLQISNFKFAVLVCGIFIGIQIIEGLWIQPRVISKRMKLHPGLVLIAITGTVFTLGIIAGLIVIPLIGSLETIISFTNRQLANTGAGKAKDEKRARGRK